MRLISRSHKGLEGKGGGEWRVSVVETGQALRVQVLSDKQGFEGDLGMFIKYFSLYSVYIQCEGFAILTS